MIFDNDYIDIRIEYLLQTSIRTHTHTLFLYYLLDFSYINIYII